MFSLPHIRRSAHTFLLILGNHHPPSSNLQGPMTSREARQERRHTAIAHTHVHVGLSVRSYPLPISFQTSLPGVGTRLSTIVPRGRRDLKRLAQHSWPRGSWKTREESGKLILAQLGKCSESTSRHNLSCYGRQPVSMPSFAVSSSEVSHCGLRT